MRIREATPQDVPAILQFVKDLADYEHLLHEVVMTEAELHEALFGAKATTFALMAEIGDKLAGTALCFYNFSTFSGKKGIYVEDLYVTPESRGLGLGKALLQQVAARAMHENCARMEWAVLDWNAPSIAFYKSLGAVAMDEWTVYRLSGESLKALAESG